MGAAEEEETAPAQQLDLRSLVPFRSGVGRSGGAHTIQPGSLRGDGGAPVPFQIKKSPRAPKKSEELSKQPTGTSR
jgi:hypothetical protein